jgi:carbon storage regulator CsrA
MLVLTRKIRESIAVGRLDGGEPMLTVTVLGIHSGKVRLGFEGDPTLLIHRWELWQRIHSSEHPEISAEDTAAPAV